MAELTSLQRAQALYILDDYQAALDIALDALKEEQQDRSALSVVAAKSYLNLLNTPMERERNQNFYSLIRKACQEANEIEEIWQIQKEASNALYQWQLKSLKMHLDVLEGNPTINNLSKCYNCQPEYAWMWAELALIWSECGIIKAFCEENGLSQKEYHQKYPMEAPTKLPATVISDAEEESMRRIFETAKVKLEANANGNPDYMKIVAQVVTVELFVAEAMSKTLIRQTDDAQVKCRRQILRTEIVQYIMNAKLYPNGQALSLYHGEDGRTKFRNELSSLYEQIQAADPQFIAPPLPSVEVVTPQQSSTSGGCYVATAVYGSYDCPQVWTLRRFRDDTLAASWYGRLFIRFYYAISPTLVKWFGQKDWFRKLWQGSLDTLVRNLQKQGVESTPYTDKVW